MPAHRIASGGHRIGSGGAALAGLVGLVALAIGLAGCKPLPLQKEKERCGGDYGGCAKGLRCSFKKKRCYRPVDCAHLQRRLKACLTEVVSVYAPQVSKLPAQKRTSLLGRIGQHLKTEMVDHCTYDAAAYQKKHGTKPSITKSFGEDRRAKEITACLRQQGCRPFAKCLLGLARVMGPKRPSPKNPAVYPISPPRPAPVVSADGGVPPTDKGAVKPGKGAVKPGMKKDLPKKVVPAMPAARPARPAPAKRPMPSAAPRPR